MYTTVVTRSIPGAYPFGASLWLFKIVPDDFGAAGRQVSLRSPGF
jgi:hypothetical protein